MSNSIIEPCAAFVGKLRALYNSYKCRTEVQTASLALYAGDFALHEHLCKKIIGGKLTAYRADWGLRHRGVS